MTRTCAWDKSSQVQNAEDRLEMLEQELKVTYLHRQDLAASYQSDHAPSR